MRESGGQVMTPSTEVHVRTFLNIADPDSAAADFLAGALRLARTNSDIREAILAIERWSISQADLLGFTLSPDAIAANDDAVTLLATVRLVHNTLLASGRLTLDKASDLTSADFAKFVDELEPDFARALLEDTRRRIASNPTFAEQIANSRLAVLAMLARGSSILNDAALPLPGTPLERRSSGISVPDAIGIIIGLGYIIWMNLREEKKASRSK
jgi:hypothetical protein